MEIVSNGRFALSPRTQPPSDCADAMGGKKKKSGKKSSKKSGNAAETGSQKSHSEMGDSDDSENEGGVEPQSTESGPVETVPEASATNDEAAEVAAAVAASAAADPAPAKAPDPAPAPPAPEKPPFEGTEEEIAAAKKIQAHQRGRQAREEFAKLKATKAAEPEDALNTNTESDADHRASQDAAMLDILRSEIGKLNASLTDARVTIKLAEDKANAAQAELDAKTREMDAKIAQADAKATEERERAERLQHQVEAFDQSAASAVGSATNERKARVEAELQRDRALEDMEKEKDKAAKAVDEAAKKIADAEAKTAEERALYDATMKRARDAEERVRESKEASLAMRAGLIRLSTVMGDSRDIRDFMRAMRAAEDSDEGSSEGIPGENDRRGSVNLSSVAASADAARLVASNDDRGANELVDECIGKLYHFLSVNADEKKELRAQVQAQQRFSKDSVGGLGMGGIGRSAALSPTSPRASNTWKQPWERSEAQSPGASALSPMAKDIAMMDMSELRTELERSRRYTTRLQTRFDKLNVEVTHQANMTLKAIEERDEAVAMLLAKAKSEEGAREDSENRARQLRAEIAQLKTDLDKRDRRFKQLTPLDAVVTEEFTRMRKESDAARRADPNAGPPASDDAVTASAVNALRSRLEKATALEKECDDLRKINAFLRRQGGSLDSSGGSGGISAAVESVMKESEDVIAALNRDGVKAEEVPVGSNTEKWRQVAMAFSGSLGKGSPPASPGALGGVLPPPPAEGDGGDDAPMSAAEVARSMDSLRSSILKPRGPSAEPRGSAPGSVSASYSTTSRTTYDSPGAYAKTITRPDDGSAIKVRSVHQLRQTHTGGTFAPPRELFRGSPYSARNSPKPRDVGPKPWDAPSTVLPASERRDPGPEWFQDARIAWDSYTDALNQVEAQRELEKEKREYAKYESLLRSGYNAAEPMRLPAHLRVKDALTSEAEVDRAVKRFVKTLAEHGASVSLRRNGPCKYMLSRTLTSAAQRGGRPGPSGPAPASKIVMLRLISNRLVVHRGTNLPPLDLLDAVVGYVQPYKPPGPVRKIADGLGRTKKWLQSWTGKAGVKSPPTATSPKPVDFSQMTRERYPEDETVPPVPQSPAKSPAPAPSAAAGLPGTPPGTLPKSPATPASNTPTGPRPFLRVDKEPTSEKKSAPEKKPAPEKPAPAV